MELSWFKIYVELAFKLREIMIFYSKLCCMLNYVHCLVLTMELSCFKIYVCRVKQMTKMSEKVATGILSGVVKVSGFFTSSVVNSKVGKKFFGLLPGEIILASLDGFSMLNLSYFS